MFDLTRVPFSRRGSYLALSVEPDAQGTPSLLLRTMTGGPKKVVARIILRNADGTACPLQYEASPFELQLHTSHGGVSICFGDADTLLFRGKGCSLSLEELGGSYDYLYSPCRGNANDWILNRSQFDSRYLLHRMMGDLSYSQNWNGLSAQNSIISADGCKSDFLFALREITQDFSLQEQTFPSYEEARKATRTSYEEFLSGMPDIPDSLTDAGQLAAYVNWSSLVAPRGNMRREGMLMSKNWMCQIWSWDHCFNAIALSYHQPKLAWDQFMLMFDYQTPGGSLPDSVNDVNGIYAFVKPPIHGWALQRMMENMQLTQEQLREACQALIRWTNWWLTYRDPDGDGICTYYHGNDSGWDNSTAFSQGPDMELPDLSAFLFVQMQTIAQLCGRLGEKDGELSWQNRASRLLDALLEHSFPNQRPAAVVNGSHEIVENQSLILYLPILLGKQLPTQVRENLLEQLRSPSFCTPFGFATQAVDSPDYRSDGYWRGPIWAPSTLLLIDGLKACGETQFAAEMARRFCLMCAKSGFAENFDALTGEGLRDKAYTWTSSVFWILAHEYGDVF